MNIIIAAAIAAISNAANNTANNTANTIGGQPTFCGCPVVTGLSGGISRQYEGTRFVRVEGVEINALQGVFVIEGAGVEGAGVEALEVRLAETRLVRTSRSGRTSWPAMIEAGWVPGFRADQVPAPAALSGLSRFVVFPVDSTGHSDWKAEVIETSAWAEAVAAWAAWRQQEGPLPSATEGVWRLARNHTRRNGGWWTAQELTDLLRHDSEAVMEDHGDEGIIFWSTSRCVCGWAPSTILGVDSGEVGCVWPLGMRTLPESSFSCGKIAVNCLQIIDNRIHWKFVSSEGVGIYVQCHDYFIWNGSPRPPFSDQEWLGKIEDALKWAKKEYEARIRRFDIMLEDAISVTDDDEEY